MKKIAVIAIGVVAAVVVMGFALVPNKIVYTNPEVIEKEVVKEVNQLDEQIKKRNDELEERFSTMQNLQARLDVFRAEKERLDAAIKETQKELADLTVATSSGTR